MRLPASSTLEKSYSTLVDTGDNENLRLVLNMAAQETYSVEEKADFSLPAVFDRKTDSIPRVEVEEAFGMGKLRIYGEYEEQPAGKAGKLIEEPPPEKIDAKEDLIHREHEEARSKAEKLVVKEPIQAIDLEDESVPGEHGEEHGSKAPTRATNPEDEINPSEFEEPGSKAEKPASETATKTIDSAGEIIPNESQVGGSSKRRRMKAFLGNLRRGFPNKRRSLATKAASEVVDVEK